MLWRVVQVLAVVSSAVLISMMAAFMVHQRMIKDSILPIMHKATCERHNMKPETLGDKRVCRDAKGRIQTPDDLRFIK